MSLTHQHPHELDYEAATTRFNKRRLIVWIALMTLGISLVWLALAMKDHVRLALTQRAALASAPAPGSLVFHDTAPSDWQHAPEMGTQNTNYVALASPDSLRPSYGSPYGCATVFLARMATPAGLERIVTIEVEKYSDPMHGNMSLPFFVTAFSPATWTRRPSDFLHQLVRSDYSAMNGVTAPAKVFAGVPDPADPSHVTFDFQLGEQRVTYDVWLRDPRPGLPGIDIIIQPREPSPKDGPMTAKKWFRH
jgi:hypothetical protein